MAHSPMTKSDETSGFHGTIGSLPLVDLLQVWAMNRFSGLVRISFQDRIGQLYFADGEIVHGEAEGQSGELALQEIISWPGGSFESFPNTATLHRTIQKPLHHLLLDAHRVLDERGRSGAPLQQAARPPAGDEPPAAPAASPSAASVLDQIRALHGVQRVVRFGSDGRTSGKEGPEGQMLAAKGLYLAVNHAAAVAFALGLGELHIAALQGEGESFVVVHRAGSYLCVALEPGTPVDVVAAQLRALLTRPAT
jgi:hypothetical protein